MEEWRSGGGMGGRLGFVMVIKDGNIKGFVGGPRSRRRRWENIVVTAAVVKRRLNVSGRVVERGVVKRGVVEGVVVEGGVVEALRAIKRRWVVVIVGVVGVVIGRWRVVGVELGVVANWGGHVRKVGNVAKVIVRWRPSAQGHDLLVQLLLLLQLLPPVLEPNLWGGGWNWMSVWGFYA